jgi:hypothetical protein
MKRIILFCLLLVFTTESFSKVRNINDIKSVNIRTISYNNYDLYVKQRLTQQGFTTPYQERIISAANITETYPETVEQINAYTTIQEILPKIKNKENLTNYIISLFNGKSVLFISHLKHRDDIIIADTTNTYNLKVYPTGIKANYYKYKLKPFTKPEPKYNQEKDKKKEKGGE